jgi:adenylate cyclase
MDADVDSETLVFEGWRFERSARVLYRQDATGAWRPASVGSRGLAILALLLERPGSLVPRDTLIKAVWPGVIVEPQNLTVQIAALRRVLDDSRPGESCIQTVPGRGYRFVPRVTQAEVVSPDPKATPTADLVAVRETPAVSRGRRTWRPWVAGFGGATIVALLLVIRAWHGGWLAGSPAPPRLSFVVLPFENLSGDPAQNYLAEGITDDLTTDLSGLPQMFVIARSSAGSYAGKTVDPRTLGRDLGVRYVVEGSMRKLGDVLRMDVRLISTETGAQLWADRFDEPIKDLSAGQEEIVERIGQTLNVAVLDIESARSKRERRTNPDAFDLILRARSLGRHPMGPREYAESLALYEQALRFDPNSIIAMTGLAEELIRRTFTGFDTKADDLARAAKLVSDATAIDPDNPNVLDAAAFLLHEQQRFSDEIPVLQHLLDRFPNWSPAYNQLGDCLIRMGRAEEAILMIKTAMRLDPQGIFAWSHYENLGWALFQLGRDEESIVATQRALAANPNNAPYYLAQFKLRLAAAHARLGELDEAHRAVADANRIWPYHTVRSQWPRSSTNSVYIMQVERYQAGLRLAGQRDHADENADFGVAPDNTLHREPAGPTPTTTPGATTIHTSELQQFLADRTPIIIDTASHWWYRSIPGAVALKGAGWGGSTSDVMQDRLRHKMQELTKGDLSTPIVAVGWNSERFDGRNLALRLVALGYTQVYWYRGGREAWEVNGLAETGAASEQDW